MLWKVRQCAHPGRRLVLGGQCRRVQSQQRLARQPQRQRRLPLTQGYSTQAPAMPTKGHFLVERLAEHPFRKHGTTPNREPRRGLRVPPWNTANGIQFPSANHRRTYVSEFSTPTYGADRILLRNSMQSLTGIVSGDPNQEGAFTKTTVEQRSSHGSACLIDPNGTQQDLSGLPSHAST